MTWKISTEEIAEAVSLDCEQRYTYSVEKIADGELVWGLRNDVGWVMMSTDEGTEVVPIWPHSKLAELSAQGEWDGYLPESLTLDEWMEQWLPGLSEDKRLVAVFPDASGEGVCLDPLEMGADLVKELKQYDEK